MARSLHRLIKIQADASGSAPQTVELLRVGDWHTPWHGEFAITPEDIKQFVANAVEGVGLVDADRKIPVNYGHEYTKKAAGWIVRVYASEDGQALLGDVEWTPAGKQALEDKEYKYLSAEFNPRGMPWEDSEEEYSFVNNVIDGAALTNIPLFKKLKPVMASRVKADAKNSNQEGEPSMDLTTLRAKQVSELTEDEKKFLSEHAGELTAEERKTFDLQTEEDKAAEQAAADKKAEEEAAAAKAAEEEKARQVEASRKGSVTIEASRLAELEANAKRGVEAAQKLAERDATDIVKRHIAAGRIKSDQLDNTVKMLLASEGEGRKALEAHLDSLPENKLLASEQGTSHQDQPVELTEEEKALGADFNLTEAEMIEHKKSKESK